MIISNFQGNPNFPTRKGQVLDEGLGLFVRCWENDMVEREISVGIRDIDHANELAAGWVDGNF